MMNQPVSEAEKMSLHDYEAMLWHWNEAHATDDTPKTDPEVTMANIERLNSDPRMTGPRPAKELVN